MCKLKIDSLKYLKYEQKGILKYIPKSAGYFVAKTGSILKINPKTGIFEIHRPTVRKDGFVVVKIQYEYYTYFELYDRYIVKTINKNEYVARLVLQAFKGEGKYIRYKDGNRLNCDIDNLEYSDTRTFLYDKERTIFENEDYSEIKMITPE